MGTRSLPCGVVLLAGAAGCLGPARAADDPPAPAASLVLTLAHGAEDALVARELEGLLADGGRVVEAFFELPFRRPIAVAVLPNRAAFTAWFPPEWGLGETACWMVAAGVDERLAILSPRVWETEACEHDARDEEHVRDVVVHELVHSFHGQYEPTRDFEGAEEIGWFLEGLATYVSGQLDRGHRERAREAVATGAVPAELESAWSGPYRYGVCGTLVAYVDATFGRDALREMLGMTREAELLGILGLTEEELLAGWREYVLRLPPP